MREVIAIVLFFGSSLLTFAQEMGQETRNGQVYKIHAVQAGNTLYGLHKKYNVSIEEIIKENPSAKEGLQIGQKLYIPFDKSASNLPNKEEKYTIHKVKRKETLYGISRSYGVTIAEIIRLNPSAEKGLDVRQKLKIPVASKESKEKATRKNELVDQKGDDTVKIKKNEEQSVVKFPKAPKVDREDSTTVTGYQIEFKDSLVKYEVQKGETLYSISRRFMVPVEQLIEKNNLEGSAIKPGQILTITLKQERIQEVEVRELVTLDSLKEAPASTKLVKKKEKYKILVVLPLKINTNGEVLSGMYSESTSLDRLTDVSVEFLMGVQMALDSLEKLGLNAKVEFFDTAGRLDQLKNKLTPNNEEAYDLLIGPLYPQLLEHAASWGKSNKVPVIAVTKIPTELLKNNPYLLSMVPSELTRIGAMAKYLAKNHLNDNIVLVAGENKATNERIQYFKDAFEKNQDTIVKKKIREVSTNANSLRTSIKPKENNFVICLSNNVQQVMEFVNSLNAAKNYSPTYGRASINMVGLQSWLDMSALNSYYKNRFELHFAASNYLNYEVPKVKEFTKHYRDRYGSDPSKYAFHGFDVMLAQGAYLLLGFDRNEGIMDHFTMSTLGANHGKENGSVFISKQKDFEIHLLEIVSNTDQFDVQEARSN